MKNTKNIILTAFAALLLAGCNEKLTIDNRSDILPPEITSFSPATAAINSQITIYGENLNNVDAVYIGGQQVTIKYRISDTEMVAIATMDGRTGKIKVHNPVGESESEGTFTYNYVAPTIDLDEVPAEAEYGSSILLTGTMMNVVTAVHFTSPGAAPSTGTILSQNDREIVVQVPYVPGDEAMISLAYFNGTSIVDTPDASNPTIEVIKYTPTVTTNTFPPTEVGGTITLEGEYLLNIDSITIGGSRANILNWLDASLDVMVPAGNFVDGPNPDQDITLHYFSGNATTAVTNSLTVIVPKVYYWSGLTIEGQNFADGSSYTSFFSPETGIAYNNSLWRTDVDPTSYAKYGVGGSCSASQTPNVTAAEYAASLPYFFISGASAGTVAINSPANSNSQLKNFRFGTTSSTYISAGNGNYFGTPVMVFRHLRSNNAREAQLIDSVVNRKIDDINPTIYPVTATTIAGVDVTTAMSGAPKNADNTDSSINWGDGTTQGSNKALTNQVFMVIYYDVNGYKSATPTANIIKYGFLHVTNFNFQPASGTPSSSTIKLNMYWMKYPMSHYQ